MKNLRRWTLWRRKAAGPAAVPPAAPPVRRPVPAYWLADALQAFNRWCLEGLAPNLERIRDNLARNLMLVTALNTHIGYDKAADIARFAEANQLTLRQAAVASGYLTEAQFDAWVDALAMTRPGV